MKALVLAVLTGWLTSAVLHANTFIVANANDSGPGSLRQAILDANANTDTDEIDFAIPTANVASITLLSALPAILHPTVIDGYTQPGSRPNTLTLGTNAALRIELNGSRLSGNSDYGVNVQAFDCVVRGLVINGFPAGSILVNQSIGSKVIGCYIDTNAAGNAVVATASNGHHSISFQGGSFNNVIGGLTPGDRNVIGASFFLEDQPNIVEGNYVGLQADGTAFPGNGIPAGVIIVDSDSNQVGGAAAGARNVIGGVVYITSGGTNLIQGNYIGTDATGMHPVLNGGGVVLVQESLSRSRRLTNGNKIVNNVVAGIGDINNPATISVTNADSNLFQGNYVGIGADGKTAMGNTNGFYLDNARMNIIGGANSGDGNIIAFNGSNPVRAADSDQVINAGITETAFLNNVINGNSIYANAGLGINLGGDNGVTPNATGGADNHPVLSSFSFSGGNVHITGSLNATASTAYRIELFGNDAVDPSGYGEGQYYLGFANVTTDASGNAFFEVTLPVPGSATAVSATATGPSGTSEFSAIAFGQLANISTRANVQTGDNIVIGGFIINGTLPKKVLVRAIGPSFNISGVPFVGRLADPFLKLFDGNGVSLAFNDNWKDTQQAQIQATGLAPSDDLESALVMTLPPGNYTAQMSGKNGTSGIGLVEIYDLDQASSQLANISTRGLVGTGDNVMIGGVIVPPASNGDALGGRVLIRGIGPSLASSSIANVLLDPMIELRDGNGTLLASNDDWKTNQAQITATGQAPKDDRESALVADLATGNYTVLLSGKNNTTGVALVEVFRLP